MKARVDYGGGVLWIDLCMTAKLVAGVWWIGRRDAENPGRRAQGLAEYAYGKSNWGVYHESSGFVAAWLHGRIQAEALALKLAEVWNGDVFNDAPLETRNKVYRLVQDALGRIKP
jgi:hypothetical protein